VNRPLPSAHVPGSSEGGQVPADVILSPPRPANGVDRVLDGFSKLFGAAGDVSTPSTAPGRGSIISRSDEAPQPSAFDDDDLAIPAFLRRSASH
jgi:hypothetical protein